MNNMIVVKELMRIAKELSSYKITDMNLRHRVPSLTEFAPRLANDIKKLIVESAKDAELKILGPLQREWSTYLTFTLPEDSNEYSNKYHYYAVYSFETPEGTYYIGANCNGGIGQIKITTDLTKKFLGGPARTFEDARRAVDKHMRTKLSKGYKPTQMIRGM